MSISASLDVSIASKSGNSLTSSEIIGVLVMNGWKIRNENKIFYLPLGDDDSFNWQEDDISEYEFYEIAKQKEFGNEIVGVAMVWENSNIGGTILIYPDGKFSFSFSVNLKKTDKLTTDVNWYMERILPCFESSVTTVENFSFTQA